MLGIIFTNLQENDIEVYLPAQKVGECLKPYTVIKPAGGNKFREYSSTVHYVDLLLYVPQGQYSTIDKYVGRVKSSIKLLGPLLKDTYYESEPYYDSDKKAFLVSIRYQYYKKI